MATSMPQLPAAGETFLDHIAHFVPDLDGAAARLERLGFVLTPFTAQQNRTAAGMVPAGMANRCIMLRRGYLEFLTAVSDTELARQFRTATARHVGVHLIAMSVGDPDAAHANLQRNGFQPADPVNLTRPLEDEAGGRREARFTVLRVPPGVMPEGRVQLLTHHTEDTVWQKRWLAHGNGVVALEAVLLAVEDPEEAATRFGRFVGRAPRRAGDRWLLPLDRGTLVFVAHGERERVAPWLKSAVAPPWIAGYALASSDTDLSRDRFADGGLAAQDVSPGETAYPLPPELGGFVTVVSEGSGVSWAS